MAFPTLLGSLAFDVVMWLQELYFYVREKPSEKDFHVRNRGWKRVARRRRFWSQYREYFGVPKRSNYISYSFVEQAAKKSVRQLNDVSLQSLVSLLHRAPDVATDEPAAKRTCTRGGGGGGKTSAESAAVDGAESSAKISQLEQELELLRAEMAKFVAASASTSSTAPQHSPPPTRALDAPPLAQVPQTPPPPPPPPPPATKDNNSSSSSSSNNSSSSSNRKRLHSSDSAPPRRPQVLRQVSLVELLDTRSNLKKLNTRSSPGRTPKKSASTIARAPSTTHELLAHALHKKFERAAGNDSTFCAEGEQESDEWSEWSLLRTPKAQQLQADDKENTASPTRAPTADKNPLLSVPHIDMHSLLKSTC